VKEAKSMPDKSQDDIGKQPQDPGPRVQAEPGQAGPAAAAGTKHLWMRLLHMVLIGIMFGMAQAALHFMALVQFIVLLTGKGQRNDQIANFGKSMAHWMAKAARFQTAESDDKPWPWSPLG
jgi:hypothetical protein